MGGTRRHALPPTDRRGGRIMKISTARAEVVVMVMVERWAAPVEWVGEAAVAVAVAVWGGG